MSRLAWVVPACVVAAVVTGGLLGGPALADVPTPSPSPTDTGPSLLQPAPTETPTPTPSPAEAVANLHAAVDTTGALVVTWRAGAGDISYTVTATAPGAVRQAETTGISAAFSDLPAGATVRIRVVAHGPGGDSPPVGITGAIPASVPGVTGARMIAGATGMLVSWRPPASAPSGTRYLVELRGADGAVRSRLVAGTRVTVTGLTSGLVYTGSVTTVTDTGRSRPVSLGGVVWTPPAAPDPGAIVAPQAGASAAATASAVPHTASPALADAPTRRTLVSSPIAAAGLAGLAVVLGGSAIGLLLRRPRPRPGAPIPQTSPVARARRP